MLPQNWVYFREVLNNKLTASNLNNEFTSEYKDQRWINRVWNTIEKIIKDSMNETIPTKEVVKSDKSNRPKLMTDTTKANKLLMRISVVTRKNQLYKITSNKKNLFIEKIKKVIEKYKIDKINISRLTKDLYDNNHESISEHLKKIKHILTAKMVIENKLFVLKQIEDSVNRRIEFMENDKKRMLNSILEREIKSINIERLLIKKNDTIQLILDEKEVLEETNKHFKGITDTKLVEDEELIDFWREEYTPRNDIEEHIYNDLTKNIEKEEWLDTIKSLSKGKAGGPSKITYDIIKELSGNVQEIMRKFYNECIKTELMPNKWSKAVIYPIPKPGEWNLDLNKTRPITLLECPRKLLIKILTNRLSKILVLHDYILGENNFAALPGKSTIEPIHIINNVLEKAREQNKELWILLQDMSKAYDLVNRERLWDAMKRIKLPKKFINIIKNSLINRKIE